MQRFAARVLVGLVAWAAIRSAAADVEVLEGALGERSEVLGAVALALRSARPLVADAA